MSKKDFMIEQQSLFPEKSSSSKESPKPVTSYKSAPNTTLIAGLDKTTLKTDGIYLLRVLANQSSRTLPAAQSKRDLLKIICTEIRIKQGSLPLELAVLDRLLGRHYPL